MTNHGSTDTTTFSVFGVGVRCDFQSDHGWPAAGPVEVDVFEDFSLSLPAARPILRLPLQNPDGGQWIEIHSVGNGTMVVVDAVGAFLLRDKEIVYRLRPGLPLASLVWQLFGFVFSVWLELHDRRVFHGAAIELGGCFVGLLGHSGAGKSTLVAALAQEGALVLSDDHLVVQLLGGRPTISRCLPWLKLGPESAVVLGVPSSSLRLLHSASAKRRFDLPSAWQGSSRGPLERILVLARGTADEARISDPLPAPDALRLLMRHSSVPRTAQALGFSVDRLPVIAQLAAKLPVHRFAYPTGLVELPRLIAAIKAFI